MCLLYKRLYNKKNELSKCKLFIQNDEILPVPQFYAMLGVLEKKKYFAVANYSNICDEKNS